MVLNTFSKKICARLVKISILISACIASWLVVEWIVLQGKVESLIEILQPHVVSDITYKGSVYEVKNGQVARSVSARETYEILSLAHFTVQAQISPVLGMPGVDTQDFERAVNQLRKSQVDMAAVFKLTTYDESYDLLYPIEFLDIWQQVEETRRALVTSPDITLAQDYTEILTEAIMLQGSYLQKLNETLAERDISENGAIYFYGGESSRDHIIGVLNHYIEISKDLLGIVAARGDCATSWSNSCGGLDYMEIEPVYESSTFVSDNVEDNTTVFSTFLDQVPAASRPDKSLVSVSRPLFCTIYNPSHYLLNWFTSAEGQEVFRPYFVSEIYIMDLNKRKDLLEDPYYRTLHERNSALVDYQPLENFYACPDFPHDMAYLYTLNEITTMPYPLHTTYNDTALAEVVQALETSWSLMQSAATINDVLVSEAVLQARTVLELDQDILTEVDRAALESVLLQYQYQTAGLPDMIRTVGYQNIFPSVANSYGGDWDVDLSIFLYTRNVPKLLLGLYSPGVTHDHKAFFKRVHLPADSIISTYSGLKTQYTPQELGDHFVEAFETEGLMAKEVGFQYVMDAE